MSCAENVKMLKVKWQYEDMHHRKGLAAKLLLKCSNCNNEAAFYTSEKVSEKKNATYKPSRVNVRSVYASQSLGNAGLRRFCANMGLPPPIGPKPYNNILKKFCEESVKLADELMCQSGKRLFDIILKEEPDNIEMANNGQMLANVPVTVDGTWRSGPLFQNRNRIYYFCRGPGLYYQKFGLSFLH